MSKYSSVDNKFRSFSPQYISESTNLYEKHLELIHQQISQLPNSPKSKKQIEQTFEEILKSVHFFRKPDIIPFPYLNFERSSEEKTENNDIKHKELLEEIEKEKNLRKIAERENTNLRDRLKYLLDIEKQYEEYKLKAAKSYELYEEIEKLNIRIKILLEENEELHKKTYKSTENFNNFKFQQELDREINKNSELSREIQECHDAYEELRKAYTRDVNSLKEKFDKLYSEKMKLEIKLRDTNESFQRPEKDNYLKKNESFSIQEKIRNMKNEYRDKLKSLEHRLGNEKPENLPDSRIKGIEERIAKIQDAIEHSSAGEKILKVKPKDTQHKLSLTERNQRSRGSTPTKDKFFTPGKDEKNTSKSPTDFLKKNNSRVKSRGRLDSSPIQESKKSLSPRTSSRKRLSEHNAECQTCIKRHGHDWAKSPS